MEIEVLRAALRRRILLQRLAGWESAVSTSAAQTLDSMIGETDDGDLLDTLEEAWGLPTAVAAMVRARRVSPFLMVGLLRTTRHMKSNTIDRVLTDAGLDVDERRSALGLGR